MLHIDDILETHDVAEHLSQRNLIAPYQKAKKFLIAGLPQKFDFKLRKPKIAAVYQFRINRKYRAFGFFRYENGKNLFLVTTISDHQD